MDETQSESGPPQAQEISAAEAKRKAGNSEDSKIRSQESSEYSSGSSQSGQCSSKNDNSQKQGHISRCRWSPMHQELLKHTFQQFGNDREFIAKLFPGFSKRLVYRKIGAIKSEIEEAHWLPKHDEVLIKAILKGASNWNKVGKRYLPRKSLDQILVRVEQLKSRIKSQKAKLDISGQSFGRKPDDDESFQSTKHTEKTGEECLSRLDDPIIPTYKAPIDRLQTLQQKENGLLGEICELNDMDHFESELFNLSTREENRDLYFDWHDNMLALNSNVMHSFMSDYDQLLDQS